MLELHSKKSRRIRRHFNVKWQFNVIASSCKSSLVCHIRTGIGNECTVDQHSKRTFTVSLSRSGYYFFSSGDSVKNRIYRQDVAASTLDEEIRPFSHMGHPKYPLTHTRIMLLVFGMVQHNGTMEREHNNNSGKERGLTGLETEKRSRGTSVSQENG